MFVIPNASLAETTIPIKTERGDFTIRMRKPTFAEAMAHDSVWGQLESDKSGEIFSRLAHMRLSLVTGWSGVKDTLGNDVPFSLAKLEQISVQTNNVFNQISKAALEFLTGRDPGELIGSLETGSGSEPNQNTSTDSPVS